MISYCPNCRPWFSCVSSRPLASRGYSKLVPVTRPIRNYFINNIIISFAIILMGKRELIAVLGLSSWCLMIVVWLFLAVPRVCLRFVIVVFPDHTHLLFIIIRHAQKMRYILARGSLCMGNISRPPLLFEKNYYIICFILSF